MKIIYNLGLNFNTLFQITIIIHENLLKVDGINNILNLLSAQNGLQALVLDICQE